MIREYDNKYATNSLFKDNINNESEDYSSYPDQNDKVENNNLREIAPGNEDIIAHIYSRSSKRSVPIFIYKFQNLSTIYATLSIRIPPKNINPHVVYRI